MSQVKLLEVDLRLFDGGGAAGAGSGGSAGAAAGSGAAAGAGDGQALGVARPGVARSGPLGAARPGETVKVLYGKQGGGQSAGSVNGQGQGGQEAAQSAGEKAGDAAAKEPGVQTSSDTLEERRRRYRELMDGEFRDLYEEDARRATGRMQRNLQALEERSAACQPVLDMLLDRYKIQDGDMAKLRQAVENDNAYWSEAAEEAGMSVEQYKQFQKLRRENEALARQQRQRIGQERANAQLQRWSSEAQELKAVYPHFDLSREAQDPNFVSMLRAGVPVRQAFEVIHMDDIKAATAAMQARATEKAVTDGIRARGARPQENGAGSGAGFTVKDDVSRLTAKDRAEIAKRVARGEVISF